MGEPGEQCTVVFALIVTEPEGVCVCIDDSALFSRFLHGPNRVQNYRFADTTRSRELNYE
jgi:hypothetical protein